MKKLTLTTKIFIALILGILFGIILKNLPESSLRDTVFLGNIVPLISNLFLNSIKMVVVPLVFISIVCGTFAMGDIKKIGKIGVKTLVFYIVTTAVAIALALGIASIIKPGNGIDASTLPISETTIEESSSIVEILTSIIPGNPIEALASGNMLQIIFFAIMVGLCISIAGKKAKRVTEVFTELNDVMMIMVNVIMKIAPLGVFILITNTFATLGLSAIVSLLKYTLAVILSLALHLCVTYGGMLSFLGRLNPIVFLKKFASVMGFAFSVSSSNATIPVTTEVLENKIGVSPKVASFTIPLGATINMDGTAIMQGVAVVFIAQAFGINLFLGDYVTVILTATLASVGTAGVPGVGLITLSMVLKSVGLPIEAIGLIMGVDRILDMIRTAVNITGDAVCTTIIAKSEGEFDENMYYDKVEINRELEKIAE